MSTEMKKELPWWQKYTLGIKKMRRLAEDNLGEFAVYSGNRYLIIRDKFEKYLQRTSSI